jgi:hypothetical protein
MTMAEAGRSRHRHTTLEHKPQRTLGATVCVCLLDCFVPLFVYAFIMNFFGLIRRSEKPIS